MPDKSSITELHSQTFDFCDRSFNTYINNIFYMSIYNSWYNTYVFMIHICNTYAYAYMYAYMCIHIEKSTGKTEFGQLHTEYFVLSLHALEIL